MKLNYRHEYTIFGILVGILLATGMYYTLKEAGLQMLAVFSILGMGAYLYLSITRHWRDEK